MRRFAQALALTAGLSATTLARDVPENLKDLASAAKSNTCKHYLQTGFYDEDGGSKNFGYCGDHLTDSGIIYLSGPKGKLANMDIDCDGKGPGDGRCGSSTDTQSQTAFEDEVAKLSGNKIKDLNANVHTYVVIGNDDTNPAFDPQKYGMEPLSVMAVVCGDKLVYGIWGDTNGNDGPPLVGEAAISTATLCFGDKVNGNSGHDEEDVLFIGFTGKDTVPKNASWTAKTAEDFEESLASLGDELIKKIGGGSSASNQTVAGTATTSSSAEKPAKTSEAPEASATAENGDDGDEDDGDDGDDGDDDDDDDNE